MSTTLAKLTQMQSSAGPRVTQGLPEAVLRDFIGSDPRLGQAIDEGCAAQQKLKAEYPELAKLSEEALADAVQASFINFYAEDQRNPYVAVAARGPWLVTFHGAVLHDSGGYGMIGFGHAPPHVLEAMSRPLVMANIMTPSFSQYRLTQRLQSEIGHTRAGGKCPYPRFILMNSGSEAVTVATRITDINAKKLTDAGGRHAGKRIMDLALKGGFHGRTEGPARISDSSQKAYRQNLASYRNLDVTRFVEPNDLAGLAAAFAWAKDNNVFYQAMFVEPVMGEGDPGRAMAPEFYKEARKLTAEMGTLLVVDSIQSAFRAQGCLSLVDYPGFRELDAPDLETYSKAVNGGQFPLSILAVGERAAPLYVRGVYGNTKTANPRACDVAVAVLDYVTPAIRKNVHERGKELLDKFQGLAKEFPAVVKKVQGTGLLVSIDIKPESFQVVGKGHLEDKLRKHGIGVIHGGANSLRFTPHFEITSKEVDLIVQALRQAFGKS